MRELEGKTAVFLGGGGNIARAGAKELARHGAHVIAFDLDGEAAAETERQVTAEGGTAESRAVEALDFEAIDGIVDAVLARHRRLDFFSFLVGFVKLEASIEVSTDMFHQHLLVNLEAQFAWAKGVARPMLDQGSGSIALIGSILGFGGIPRRAGYTAARGGIIQLVRTLGVEWAPKGVRVNALAPGWIETPGLESLGLPLDDYRQRTPMQRLGTPEDIAGPLRFLASDASRWITGQTIPVDGGVTSYLGPADPATA